MKRIVRFCFIIAVACLCIALLVFVGVSVYLNTDHARTMIQDRVNRAISGEIIVGDLHFSPLKGEFSLKHAALRDRHHSEIAGLNSLRIELSWITLAKGTLTLKKVVLEDPWADLYADTDGTVNLVHAFMPVGERDAQPKEASRAGGFPASLRINSLNLSNGSVRYEEASSGSIISLKGIDFSAEGELLKQSARIVLQIDEGRIDSPELTTKLARSRISAALQGDRLDEILIEALTPAVSLAASGSISDIFRKPVFDLSLNVAAALPELQKSLSQDALLTGEVKAQVTAKGRLNDPAVAMSLTYEGGMLSGNSVDRASLDLMLIEKLLTINNLNVRIGSGNLNIQGTVDLSRAFHQGFISPQRNLTAISYHVLAKGTQIRLEQLQSAVEHGLSGTLAFAMELSGTGLSLEKMSALGDIEADLKTFVAPRLQKPIDLAVAAGARLKDGVVAIQKVDAESGFLSLKSSGRFDLSSGSIAGRLAIEVPDLSETLAGLGIDTIRGGCSIKGTVSGSTRRPAFDFALQGSRLGYGNVTLGNIAVNANFAQSGRLKVAMFSLENQGSLINATGSVKILKEEFFEIDRTIPLNLSVSLQDVDLRDFFAKGPIEGRIHGQANLDGSLQSLMAVGTLRGEDLKAKGNPIGDCETIFRFSDGNISVEKMEIRHRKSLLRFSGTAHVFDWKTKQVLSNPPFTLDVNAATLYVEDFIDSLKGKVSLAAAMEGTVRRPKGTLNLSGKDVDLGIQGFQEVNLTCVFDGQKAWFRPLHLTVAPGEFVELSGWLTLDQHKQYQIEMISKGVSLGSIQKMKHLKDAAGGIAFTVSGQGTLEDPQLKGNVILKNPRFKDTSFEDFKLHFELRDKLARISGKLNFDVAASFHLQDKDFSATLLFRETDLDPYFKIAGKDRLSGILTGKVEANGNIEALRQVHAYGDFSQLHLFLKDNKLIDAPRLQASLKDEKITIEADKITLLNQGHIDIRGNGTINGPIDFQAAGTVPLETARAFTPYLPDIAGLLTLSANVKGTWSRPDIKADMAFRDVSFTIPVLAQKLHDVQGSIRIEREAVAVEGLEGRVDTGRFDLEGTIGLEGLRPSFITMNFNANSLPVQVPDMLELVLHTRLRMNGPSKNPVIRGEIILLEGTYYRDVNLSILQAIGEKKREVEPPSTRESLSFLSNISLDISIKHRGPFIVDNNLARLDVIPDLRVSGALSRPIITGRASVERGTITYRREEFMVRKGIIDFTNPYRTEPAVDIQGEVEIRQWTIYLTVAGRPDRLSFELTSDPPEEDGDIVSLLLMGKTRNELIKAEGGTTQSAERLLARVIATALEEDIKRATGFDIFEIETQPENDAETSDQIRVTLGKELSKRMTVKYIVEPEEGELSQRAIAEYKLLESLLLSSYQDNKGVHGGEILFRLEFR
ncbi:MAG: translocation/assembly module TamB domain-containing protein [Thermodesulfobacteriota bacterium]